MGVFERILRVGIAAFENIDEQLRERQGEVFSVNLVWWSSKRHLFLMLFELFVPGPLHLLLLF